MEIKTKRRKIQEEGNRKYKKSIIISQHQNQVKERRQLEKFDGWKLKIPHFSLFFLNIYGFAWLQFNIY